MSTSRSVTPLSSSSSLPYDDESDDSGGGSGIDDSGVGA